MLDQNTDRMWYVIGAVLIGAAVILIANESIPQMFASVTDSFEEVNYNATVAIDQLSDPNLYHESKVINAGIRGYPNSSGTVTYGGGTRGLYIPVKAGESYTIARSDTRNSRFAYAFSEIEPNKEGVPLYNVDSDHADALMIENIEIPEGANYLFVYLYERLATSTDLPDITIIRN